MGPGEDSDWAADGLLGESRDRRIHLAPVGLRCVLDVDVSLVLTRLAAIRRQMLRHLVKAWRTEDGRKCFAASGRRLATVGGPRDVARRVRSRIKSDALSGLNREGSIHRPVLDVTCIAGLDENYQGLFTLLLTA